LKPVVTYAAEGSEAEDVETIPDSQGARKETPRLARGGLSGMLRG
jgi:hypothetical protein